MLVILEQGHLNFWTQKRLTRLEIRVGFMTWLMLAVATAVIVTGYQGGRTPMHPPDEVTEGAILGLAAIIAAFAGFIVSHRNKTIMTRFTGSSFDDVFKLQSRIVYLNIILLSILCVLTAFMYDVFYLHPSSLFWIIVSLTLIAYLASEATSAYGEIIDTNTLARLCLQNFIEPRKDITEVNLGQLRSGLRTIERSLRKYGVVAPADNLAFAVTVSLLRGTKFDDKLISFMRILEEPSPANIKLAFISCQALLKRAREHASLGLEMPRPLWRRILIQPVPELANNLVYLALLVSAIVSLVLGYHILP